jgi:hypothetical protein
LKTGLEEPAFDDCRRAVSPRYKDRRLTRLKATQITVYIIRKGQTSPTLGSEEDLL